MINLPTYTAKGPNIKLSPEYKKKWKNSLFCKSIKASLESVEKVVKPPHKPTVRNNLQSGVRMSPFSVRPKIIPINRLPAILIRKVLQGKTVV